MDYIPGGSVADLLSRYGPFEESLARNFVQQVLSALSYLHEQHIFPRNIRGVNILVDNAGQVKVSSILRKSIDGQFYQSWCDDKYIN